MNTVPIENVPLNTKRYSGALQETVCVLLVVLIAAPLTAFD